ncbi:hypothetical protein ACFWU5_16635 [Nocardia sp. NPDC058640]|uniref:hypothetical protein n=1 Tax=Nocardia sp. NPDC058640 TaxID=3346571 RepID=UPI003665A99E
MRSILWSLGSTTGLNPDRLYAVRGGWAHPSPVTCPNGHSLSPRRVLVGTQACLAVDGYHRTYACRRCNTVIMWPPVTAVCDHQVFDERRAR